MIKVVEVQPERRICIHEPCSDIMPDRGVCEVRSDIQRYTK